MTTIWNFIYELFKPITDNVYVIILFISIFAAVILFLTQYGLSKIIKKEMWLPFGPLSMIFTYLVADMTVRLPVFHPRIRLALSTVSGIVGSSKTYADNFEMASGVTIKGSQTIASHLYHLTEPQQETWSCQPEALYDSVFRTLNQTRGGIILPDVHISCFGDLNVVFIMAILTIIFMGSLLVLYQMGKKRYVLKIVWFIISSAFLIWMCTINSGAAVCCILMWYTSVILYGLSKI